MSKKSSLYDRVKTIDQLLHNLNNTISRENTLLSEMNNTSKLFRDLYSEANKAFSNFQRQPSGRNYNDELDGETLNNIDTTLTDIYTILKANQEQDRHNQANVGGRGNSGNKETPTDLKSALKGFIGDLAKSYLVKKLFNAIADQAGQTMKTSYTMSQIGGTSALENGEAKDVVNRVIGWSSIYDRNDAYALLPEMAAQTGYDDFEEIAKYTKSIMVATESMNLDTGMLYDIIYSMDKRGTFTPAMLNEMIDNIYAYSSVSDNITPDELAADLDGLNDLLVGLFDQGESQEEVNRERNETLAVSAGALDQGISASAIVKAQEIMKDFEQNGTDSSYTRLLQSLGIAPDTIQSYINANDSSGWEQFFLSTVSQMANQSESEGNSHYHEKVIRSLLGDMTNTEYQALRGYDPTHTVEIPEDTPSAEEGAEDYSRDLWDRFKTFTGNFFSNLSDTLSEHGIGSGTMGVIGTTAAYAINKATGIGKKAVNGIKNFFGKGSDIADDATNAAANSVDDVAAAAINSADDALSATANSIDDVANAAIYSMDDVVGATSSATSTAATTALGSMDEVATGATSYLDDIATAAAGSADEVASAVGSTLSKVAKGVQIAGIAIEAITTGIDAYDAFSNDDKREGWSEIGEGIGSIGGGLGGAAAGAAIGTAILPGIGTAVGSIIGGVAGSLGGGKVGREAAGAIADAAYEETEFSDDIKTQIKNFYDKVSEIYLEEGNNAAQEYTLNYVVPYLNEVGVSESITDKYKWDVGKPDFMKDYENDKFLGYYATGTPYLPSDGLVYAHQGESIIPATLNPNNPASILSELEESSISKDDIDELFYALKDFSKAFTEFTNYIKDRNAKEDIKSTITEAKTTLLSKVTGGKSDYSTGAGRYTCL